MKNENNNQWFKPWFNILLHTQSSVCATVDNQWLEYLGYNFGCNKMQPSSLTFSGKKRKFKNSLKQQMLFSSTYILDI